MNISRRVLPLAISTLLPLSAAAQPAAPAAAPLAVPLAQFADPARAAKLAAAFPEVEQILTTYAERAHIPGYAFGVIVDGRMD